MSESAMKKANVRFNYQDYLLLREDKRYEILDGDLCMVPSPGVKHQTVCLNLRAILLQHVRERNFGKMLTPPCDVVLSDEDVVQPDIIFIRRERCGSVTENNIRGAPDLVVEVLSPGTCDKDIGIKQKIYATFGVREYWIVDPEARNVEVLLWSERGYASGEMFSVADRLSSPLLPGLNLPVSEIFRE